MKFCFIVQGEGRGHLIQSVAVREILENNGHKVIKVFLGGGYYKSSSSFYRSEETIHKKFFLSPFFIPSKNHKGINLGFTFLVNAILLPVYLIESLWLAFLIKLQKPDAVINFYDIVGGISFLFIGKNIRKYVISHHFFFEHPDFTWPENRVIERKLMLIHSGITSFMADKKLALSFTSATSIPNKKLYIIPPLLRKSILDARVENLGHIHVYTLNSGYYREMEEWCEQNPSIQIKMFSNFRNIPVSKQPNLKYSSLSTEGFLQSLVTCLAVASTSGFETLAESAYLGKHLQVVPSENHFEQYCNALDLERAGLGKRKSDFFPLSEIPKNITSENTIFKNWVMESDKLLLLHLCPE